MRHRCRHHRRWGFAPHPENLHRSSLVSVAGASIGVMTWRPPLRSAGGLPQAGLRFSSARKPSAGQKTFVSLSYFLPASSSVQETLCLCPALGLPAEAARRSACDSLPDGAIAKSAMSFCYELHDSIEQPARSRAQSGRFSLKASRPGWSSYGLRITSSNSWMPA